jgi:hypothetical protein
MNQLEEMKRLPGGSRGRRGSNGNLPAAMRALKERTLKSGKEIVEVYPQVGRKNVGPTATNIRLGKAAGLLGFNADWRWEDEQQVLRFSYTGCWHGRGEPPDGLEQGPCGYSDDYKLHEVTEDVGLLDKATPAGR